jgi:transmembrane sensor
LADARLIEAAHWAERRADGLPLVGFDAWLADPANDRAWRSVDAVREATLAEADHPDLLAMRHAAVARAALGRGERRSGRWWPALAAACLAVAAAPLATWYVMRDGAASPASPVLATEVGQRLVVRLPDGSRMTLNTASRVRLAYSYSERRLVLERGQAFFDVAKHQSRPFVVVAGGERVTAHGTEFDVRLEPGAVRVALVEGKVSVAPAAARGPAVMMKPDDVLTARAGTISLRHVEGRAASLSSWSEGRLVFQDEPLGKAVAELNRYGTPPIVVADARAARVRISASLRTGDIDPFLDALELGFPVRVVRQADGGARIESRR